MTLSWLNFREVRAFRLSDDQEKDGRRAHRRLTAAIMEMRAAIEDVDLSSVLVEIEPTAFDNFVSDEFPSVDYWEEKRRDPRRLYIEAEPR